MKAQHDPAGPDPADVFEGAEEGTPKVFLSMEEPSPTPKIKEFFTNCPVKQDSGKPVL